MSTYWVGKTVVVEWELNDPDGVFIDDATVTGTITLPDASTSAMVVVKLNDRYRASYEPVMSGLHAYRLEATGGVESAEEGTFVVRLPLVGADPITTNPTTDIGRVRLLCTDLNEVTPLFTDAQISAFLAMESDDVRLAAALALETIASSEALVSKKIRDQDLQTDGPAVAKELRERATALRKQAAEVDDDGETFGMSIVDFDPDRGLVR